MQSFSLILSYSHYGKEWRKKWYRYVVPVTCILRLVLCSFHHHSMMLPFSSLSHGDTPTSISYSNLAKHQENTKMSVPINFQSSLQTSCLFCQRYPVKIQRLLYLPGKAVLLIPLFLYCIKIHYVPVHFFGFTIHIKQ